MLRFDWGAALVHEELQWGQSSQFLLSTSFLA